MFLIGSSGFAEIPNEPFDRGQRAGPERRPGGSEEERERVQVAMASAKVYDQQGTEVGSVDLAEDVFSADDRDLLRAGFRAGAPSDLKPFFQAPQ